MTDMNLAMVLSLKDKMVGPLRQAVEQVEREFVDLERQAKKTGTATAAVADGITKVGRTAGNAKAVATELRKVGDEASRATRELTTMEQAGSRMRGLMSGAAKGVAGVMAFNHVVADPVRRAADYDMSLRRLANTTYAGKSIEERRAGMGAMNKAITNSVRTAGGTREGAFDALNELVSSGAFASPEQAISMLPVIMKSANVSGGSANEMATIAIRAKQTMGINSAEGLAEVMDRAMAAGQAGGFELKDMAKWLPQQMAAAKSLGMTGMGGISQLLAANQATVITAGTKDEAGNNLVNLLGKINAPDTVKDFQKHGVKLTDELINKQTGGFSSLEGFIGLVQQVVSANPAYTKLRLAADGATDEKKKEILSSQADIMQGSVVGTVIQDRQALMALLGIMNNLPYVEKIKNQLDSAKGTTDSNNALITEGAAYKFDQSNFDDQEAQTRAMNQGNGILGWLADTKSSLYRSMPDLAAAYEGSKVMVNGIGGAIAGAGLWNLLSGGGASAGAASAGSFASTIATSAAGAATSVSGLASGAVMMAPVLASINPNRDFVGAVADPSMMGSADFASALSDSIAQSKAAADAAKAAAERPIEVKVMLDGHQLEAAVTKQTDSKARRGQ
jgi:hypothetical protein